MTQSAKTDIHSDTAFAALCEEAARLAPDIESDRKLPATFARDLAAHGMFSMFVPEQIGGGEVSPVFGMQKLHDLAQYDAASAWVCMIGSTAALGAAYIAPDLSQEISPPINASLAGFSPPVAVACATAMIMSFQAVGRGPQALPMLIISGLAVCCSKTPMMTQKPQKCG